MKNKRARHFSFLAFVIYFSVFALLPATHCHASDGLVGDSGCGPGHPPKHRPFFSEGQCCELYEGNHAESGGHHIHFLIDDQGFAAARHPSSNSQLSPQVLAEVVESLHQLPNESFAFVSSLDNVNIEAVLSYSSGLSPPVS